MKLSDVEGLVKASLTVSRSVGSAELDAAINHGYRRVINAILDARADHFLIETGDFTVVANQLRHALTGPAFTVSSIARPVIRIRRLESMGPDAPSAGVGNSKSSLIRKWTYRAITAREFLQAELLAPSDVPEVFYDLIHPLGVPTLAIAPAMATDDTPFLSAIYQPVRLVLADDPVEPIVDKHIEVVVGFALEQLLRAVNDADCDRWGMDAKEMLSALIQHVAAKQEHETQAIGSALWGLGSD